MSMKQVFVSHAGSDKTIAAELCERLEAADISCWIAKQNITAGYDWAEKIVEALENCHVVVLILSDAANKSKYVRREIQLATSLDVPIVQVRIEDVTLTRSMSFFLGTEHRLDALPLPIDDHVEHVISAVREHLAEDTVDSPEQNHPPTLESAIVSIAVLPFEYTSGTPEHAFFAGGIADELRNTLAKVHRLRVAARAWTVTESSANTASAEIGRKLDVRFVVSGNAQCAGNQVRVNVVLDNVEDGSQIWAESFTRDIDDPFAIQQEIAEAVASQFGNVRLRDEIAAATERPTDILGAWGLVQRARSYILQFTPYTLVEATELLEKAIRLDPDYAAAHAALGAVIGEQVMNGFSDRALTDRQRANESADRAIRLAPSDPFVLKMCGVVWAYFGRFDESLGALRNAVRIAPFDFGAWGYLGWPLVQSGAKTHLTELHEIMEKILLATPNHPGVCYWLYHRSVAFSCQQDHASAVDFARESVDRNPSFPWGWMHYANTLGSSGATTDEVKRAVERCLALSPALTPHHFQQRVSEMSAYPMVVDARLAGLKRAGVLD